jgi:DNA-binding HxlR family transcriptional regulator/putative sterol carrier protein
MTTRTYGQFCGVARALELVGERWALLIVRDLLVAPLRYTDLKAGLPKIPTNVLATRLKELEQAGIVERRLLPRPSGSVVYQLTGYGEDLEEVVHALGRWGARSLGERGPDEIPTTCSMIVALRSTFRPAAAKGLRAGFELHLGEIVIHALVSGRKIEVGAGPLEQPDLVLHTTSPLRPLLSGEVDAEQVVADGTIRVDGDPALLARFAELFPLGPAPAAGG